MLIIRSSSSRSSSSTFVPYLSALEVCHEEALYTCSFTFTLTLVVLIMVVVVVVVVA